jgi:hypothetical protein
MLPLTVDWMLLVEQARDLAGVMQPVMLQRNSTIVQCDKSGTA